MKLVIAYLFARSERSVVIFDATSVDSEKKQHNTLYFHNLFSRKLVFITGLQLIVDKIKLHFYQPNQM